MRGLLRNQWHETKVYLKPPGGGKEQVFPGVAYGAMSDYLRVPAGTYSVAMRKHGAKPSTPAVLTLSVAAMAASDAATAPETVHFTSLDGVTNLIAYDCCACGPI